MKKQLITVIIAIVVLGGLVGAYFLVQHLSDDTVIVVERPENIDLINRNKRELVSVTFITEYGEVVLIPELDHRDRQQWSILGYEEIDMNSGIMDSMTTPVSFMRPIEQIGYVSDGLAAFGLDNPSATAIGVYEDGTEVVVHLGFLTPDGQYYYMMVEGYDGVYLLLSITGDRFFLTPMDLAPTNVPVIFIDSLVYAYFYQRNRHELEFAFVGPEDDMQRQLANFGMVLLSMIQPFPGRDLYMTSLSSIVLEYIPSMFFVSIVEIFPENLSIYGLDEPEIEVILIDSDFDVFHLIFGDSHDDTHVYVMVEGRPIVYTIRKTHMAHFRDINVFDMLDRFVALVPLVDVDYITVISHDHGREHTIYINREFVPSTRADRDYDEVLNPDIDGIPVEEDSFRRFYQRLVGFMYDVQIHDFEKEGDPVFTIVFGMVDGRDNIVTRYFPFNNDFYAVQRDDNPIQFVVNKRSVDIMFDTMDRLLAGERLR